MAMPACCFRCAQRTNVEVKVSGNTYFMAPRQAYNGITTGSYSLKTIHEAALLEGALPCPW